MAEMRRNSSPPVEGEIEVPWFYIYNKLNEADGKFYIYMNIPSTKKNVINTVTLKDVENSNNKPSYRYAHRRTS